MRPSFSIASDESGLSTVEYIIVLVLIAIVAIGAWKRFGAEVKEQTLDSATAIRGLGG